jgi:predicted methyltransferase
MSRVGKVHGLFHSEFYPPDYYDAMARCLKYDLFHYVSHTDNLRRLLDHGLVLERKHAERFELAKV